MDLLNVPAATTSSGSTKVLIQEGNTLKSRTASDLVSGSSGKFFQTTIIGALGSGASEPIDVYSSDNGYGWPYDGIGPSGQPADSLSRCYKFAIPFNPTAYRFTCVCVTAATNSPATSGAFGVKFQWSTDNSSWSTGGVDNDIATLNFRDKAIGDLASVNGTLSISGSPTLVYIRCVQVNTLSPTADGSIAVRGFIANFWN